MFRRCVCLEHAPLGVDAPAPLPSQPLAPLSLPALATLQRSYLTNRYDAVVAQVPLMAVHAAGRVRGVDPDLWTPPPLRQGAAGWNPEWGKVWQWWGVPRYTL